MKKSEPIVLNIFLTLTMLFSLCLFVMFLLSDKILPDLNALEDANEALGIALSFLMLGVVFVSIPCIAMAVVFLILDICLLAVKNKKPTLVATLVLSILFSPLFFLASTPFLYVVQYTKWLLAILIPAYISYIGMFVLSAVNIAIINRRQSIRVISA